MSDFDFEIKADDKKQLKKLYEEATALDKKVKMKNLLKNGFAIDKILNPYLEANKKILISASKVKINGKVYFAQNR